MYVKNGNWGLEHWENIFTPFKFSSSVLQFLLSVVGLSVWLVEPDLTPKLWKVSADWAFTCITFTQNQFEGNIICVVVLIWCISTYIFIYNRGIGTAYVRNEENKPWSWQIAKHHSILHDSHLFIHFMMVSSSDSRRTGVLNIILYCKCRRSIFVTWRQLNRQVTFIQCSQKVLYSFIFHKNSRRCISLFNLTQNVQ